MSERNGKLKGHKQIEKDQTGHEECFIRHGFVSNQVAGAEVEKVKERKIAVLGFLP